jgi:hypothetical protein
MFGDIPFKVYPGSFQYLGTGNGIKWRRVSKLVNGMETLLETLYHLLYLREVHAEPTISQVAGRIDGRGIVS